MPLVQRAWIAGYRWQPWRRKPALLSLNERMPQSSHNVATLYLHGNAPTVGAGWSGSGRRRDPRQLKHRAEGEVRSVPCHPALTRYLRHHIGEFGTAPDGRLFRGERGGDLSESVYQRAWQDARMLAFTPPVAVSPLAGRPYDLRHAPVHLAECGCRPDPGR
jgi:hypothetical protein